MAVGFLAVGSKFLLPFGAEFGGVQNNCSLVDCILESRDGALTFFEWKYRNYMIYTIEVPPFCWTGLVNIVNCMNVG